MHQPLRLALLVAAIHSGGAIAQAKPVDIAAQNLGSALTALATQSGIQILFNADEVKGATVAPLHGQLGPEEALRKLLEGSGLVFGSTGKDTYVIKRSATGQTVLPEVLVKDTRVTADTEGSKSYGSKAVTVAGKVPLERKEIPRSISVITRQQMDDQNLFTISDALKQATGVTLISNNSSQDQFAIRGAAPNVQLDGVPVYDGLSGYQQFDMAIYDRVEVLRGPAGLLDGSGSFAGTVNLVKKMPKKETAASAIVSLGSWNNQVGQVDVTGPLNDDKTLRGRLVGSVQDRDYFFDRAHGNRSLGYGVIEYDFTRSTTGSLSYATQADQGPGFTGIGNFTNTEFMNVPRSTNSSPSWQRINWNSEEYGAGLEHHFDNGWVAKFKANRREQSHHFKDAYPTTGVTPGTYNIATYNRRDAYYWFTRDGLDTNLSGSFDLLGRTHQVLVGYNYDWFRTTSKSRTAQTFSNVNLFNPDVIPELTTPFTGGTESITTQQGLYGNLRFKLLDSLTLTLGGRFTDFNAKSHNIAPATPTAWKQGAEANNEFTPYGGLVLEVTKNINIYGSYADIFVPQTQLAYGGGTLEPKVGRQYEIGAKGEFFERKLDASVALFNIQDQNRAYADPDHTGFYLPLGKVESQGLDLEASGSPLPGLELNTGYTYQTTKNLVAAASSVGKPINNWYPKHNFKLWSNYRPQSGELAGFNFGLGVNGQSATTSNCTGCKVLKQGGYSVWTAQVGYQLSKNLSANLTVENLFDRTYYTRIQGDNTLNYFGTPRNFMLTLRASY